MEIERVPSLLGTFSDSLLPIHVSVGADLGLEFACVQFRSKVWHCLNLGLETPGQLLAAVYGVTKSNVLA